MSSPRLYVDDPEGPRNLLGVDPESEEVVAVVGSEAIFDLFDAADLGQGGATEVVVANTDVEQRVVARLAGVESSGPDLAAVGGARVTAPVRRAASDAGLDTLGYQNLDTEVDLVHERSDGVESGMDAVEAGPFRVDPKGFLPGIDRADLVADVVCDPDDAATARVTFAGARGVDDVIEGVDLDLWAESFDAGAADPTHESTDGAWVVDLPEGAEEPFVRGFLGDDAGETYAEACTDDRSVADRLRLRPPEQTHADLLDVGALRAAPGRDDESVATDDVEAAGGPDRVTAVTVGGDAATVDAVDADAVEAFDLSPAPTAVTTVWFEGGSAAVVDDGEAVTVVASRPPGPGDDAPAEGALSARLDDAGVEDADRLVYAETTPDATPETDLADETWTLGEGLVDRLGGREETTPVEGDAVALAGAARVDVTGDPAVAEELDGSLGGAHVVVTVGDDGVSAAVHADGEVHRTDGESRARVGGGTVDVETDPEGLAPPVGAVAPDARDGSVPSHGPVLAASDGRVERVSADDDRWVPALAAAERTDGTVGRYDAETLAGVVEAGDSIVPPDADGPAEARYDVHRVDDDAVLVADRGEAPDRRTVDLPETVDWSVALDRLGPDDGETYVVGAETTAATTLREDGPAALGDEDTVALYDPDAPALADRDTVVPGTAASPADERMMLYENDWGTTLRWTAEEDWAARPDDRVVHTPVGVDRDDVAAAAGGDGVAVVMPGDEATLDRSEFDRVVQGSTTGRGASGAMTRDEHVLVVAETVDRAVADAESASLTVAAREVGSAEARGEESSVTVDADTVGRAVAGGSDSSVEVDARRVEWAGNYRHAWGSELRVGAERVDRVETENVTRMTVDVDAEIVDRVDLGRQSSSHDVDVDARTVGRVTVPGLSARHDVAVDAETVDDVAVGGPANEVAVDAGTVGRIGVLGEDDVNAIGATSYGERNEVAVDAEAVGRVEVSGPRNEVAVDAASVGEVDVPSDSSEVDVGTGESGPDRSDAAPAGEETAEADGLSEGTRLALHVAGQAKDIHEELSLPREEALETAWRLVDDELVSVDPDADEAVSLTGAGEERLSGMAAADGGSVDPDPHDRALAVVAGEDAPGLDVGPDADDTDEESESSAEYGL